MFSGWMKRGDVIGMHTFDVIARGIADIFVYSLAVFVDPGKKEWRHTHVSLSTCSIVLRIHQHIAQTGLYFFNLQTHSFPNIFFLLCSEALVVLQHCSLF